MSQGSIDRWNAIPLSRTEQETASLKRSRPGDGDSDNDDSVSLVSRSPSPMQVDLDITSLDKYDEFVRGVSREVITVETKIKPSNKGFAMLTKLGWSEGQPLGISEDGRIDPIPFQIKRDSTGLGKTNQDVKMIETTVSQRRGMDSERQQKETEDQRRAREELVARKSALEDEISSTLKAFFCTLCEKQFKTVAQYDEHTNSYAHHHKARFKDMQANVRLKPKDDIDKRKEKERKREEKELRKIAAANGIRMAKPTIAPPPLVPVEVAPTTPDAFIPAPSKTGGWAAVSGIPQVGPSTSNWRSFGSAPVLPQQSPTTEPSSTTREASKSATAPAFRTAGWTSLDTGSSQVMPPAPTASPPQPPPQPPSLLVAHPPPPPSDHPQFFSTQSLMHNQPVPPPSAVPIPPTPPTNNASAQPVRNTWQQFQKLGAKRR